MYPPINWRATVSAPLRERYQSPVIRYSCIDFAARRPAPIARISVAAPVTISPPANPPAVSTVNLAEVQSKLVITGWDAQDAWEDATAVVRQIFAFTTEHARDAGSLIAQTRTSGLSLGDRACLALALELNAPVYTADRSWKNLKLAVPIHVIC